jgi:hypothetical protein
MMSSSLKGVCQTPHCAGRFLSYFAREACSRLSPAEAVVARFLRWRLHVGLPYSCKFVPRPVMAEAGRAPEIEPPTGRRTPRRARAAVPIGLLA